MLVQAHWHIVLRGTMAPAGTFTRPGSNGG